MSRALVQVARTGREGGGWGAGRGLLVFGSRTGFYRPETVCHEKIVFIIKSIAI